MPRPGGYPPIRVARDVPRAISTPVALGLVAAGAAAIVGGLYRVGQMNAHRASLKKEREEVRRALLPFLQAEADATFMEGKKAYRELEAQVMDGVEGWVVDENVYKTKKFVPPALSTMPKGGY